MRLPVATWATGSPLRTAPEQTRTISQCQQEGLPTLMRLPVTTLVTGSPLRTVPE